jgi:hypothetical protein
MNVQRIALCGILSLALGSLQTLKAADNAPTHRSLQSVSFHLAGLIPALQSPKAFSQPQNHDALLQHIQGLGHQAHPLSFERPATTVNHAYRYIYPGIDQDLALAAKQFEQNNKGLAKALLAKNIRLCLDCHSRDAKGQRHLFHHTPAEFAAWSSLQKASFYAATWNFAEAIRYYEYALSDKRFSNQSQAWRDSLKQLISIVIRFKKTPSLAMEMSQVFIDKKTAPKEQIQVLQAWTATAESWRSEKSYARTRRAKLKKIKSLYQTGVHKNQKAPHTGTIDIVRAQNLASSVINEPIFDKLYGAALYWAAKLSEASPDINIWADRDALFEACIRYQPHTPVAQDCFNHVDREYLEYARLSTKNQLPPALALRLKKLARLAQEKP